MKKIIFSITLSLLILTGNIYGADITVGGEESDYLTLSEAVSNASALDKIILENNIDISNGGVTITKELILDLNGFELKALNGTGGNITVKNSKLTVEDSSVDNLGIIKSTGHIEVGNIGGRGVIDVENSQFILNSGSIITEGDGYLNAILVYYGTIENPSTVTINGGLIQSVSYAISNHNQMSGNSLITINGGTIKSAIYSTYMQKYENHDITINGGTITSVILQTSAAYAYVNGIVPTLTIGDDANVDDASIVLALYNSDLDGKNISELFNLVSTNYEISSINSDETYNVINKSIRLTFENEKNAKLAAIENALNSYSEDRYTEENYNIIVKNFEDVKAIINECTTIEQLNVIDVNTYIAIANKLPVIPEITGDVIDKFNIVVDNVNQTSIFTDEEINSGEKLDFKLNINETSYDNLSDEEKLLLDNSMKNNFETAMILDISFLKIVGDSESNINKLSDKIKLTMDIPEEFKSAGRTFEILRLHDGLITVIDDLDDSDDTITFETDSFSSYVLTYTDDNSLTNPETSDLMFGFVILAVTLIFITTLSIIIYKITE